MTEHHHQPPDIITAPWCSVVSVSDPWWCPVYATLPLTRWRGRELSDCVCDAHCTWGPIMLLSQITQHAELPRNSIKIHCQETGKMKPQAPLFIPKTGRAMSNVSLRDGSRGRAHWGALIGVILMMVIRACLGKYNGTKPTPSDITQYNWNVHGVIIDLKMTW